MYGSIAGAIGILEKVTSYLFVCSSADHTRTLVILVSGEQIDHK